MYACVKCGHRRLEDVLVELSVVRADHGDLHKALDKGFADTAKIIAARGGLAIPAHADKEKGLLRLAVADRINQTLLDDAIGAIEIVDLTEAEKLKARVDGRRELAVIRSSDTTAPGASWHVLQGSGDQVQDPVLTYVQSAAPLSKGRGGTGVAVPAAVPGAFVGPVRDHPSAAVDAEENTDKLVLPRCAVRWLGECVDVLGGDEVRFGDQRRVCGFGGDDPVLAGVAGPFWFVASVEGAVVEVVMHGLAVPDLSAGVARVLQDRLTVVTDQPIACRWVLRARSYSDGHATPPSFSSRAIPARLIPAKR